VIAQPTAVEPVVEWDTAALQSEEWRRGIAGARAALDALLSASETARQEEQHRPSV
jgi:hypothetical protein